MNKVAILGNFGQSSEGMAKTAQVYASELSSHFSVSTVNLSQSPIKIIRLVHSINPDIIHFVPGPSNKSLFLTKILDLTLFDVKIVHSCTHRKGTLYPFLWRHVDAAFLQGRDNLENLEKLHTTFIPSGVDVSKFCIGTGSEFSDRWGIPPERKVLLHVGHIKESRGVGILRQVVDNDSYFVILVGNDSTSDQAIVNEFNDYANSIAITDYLENIEHAYQAADLYIFPVPPGHTLNSIMFPLSVLEALSTGLPVLTTPFGALEFELEEHAGVRFSDYGKIPLSILNEFDELVAVDKEIIREQTLEYSWTNVIQCVETEYNRLLNDGY